MSGEPIPQGFALKAQLAAFAGNEPASSFLEVRPLKPTGEQVWIPVRKLNRGVAEVYDLRDHHEVFIGVNPRTERRGTSESVERSWCLVADIDTPEAAKRRQSFRPKPSIIVASGGESHRLHCYWPLRRPIPPAWARGANLRIARALGSDDACVDPARVMRAIGSINRKAEPTPVRCLRLEIAAFEVGDVVAGLPDDPRLVPRARPERRRVATEGGGTLDGLVRTVTTAEVGNRNHALPWAGCRAAEDIDAGAVDEAEAREALRAAALAAGLDEPEVAATLRSALKRRAAA